MEGALGCDVDYAMLVKIYGLDPQKEKRYSASKWVSAERILIRGNHETAHFSTSYGERQDLTMRMRMRQFRS